MRKVHNITSHHMEKTEAGLKVQTPLYPRNNDKVHFILHKILYYNTTVSDAMEICFVIIHHVLIDPEFITQLNSTQLTTPKGKSGLQEERSYKSLYKSPILQ